MQRTTKGYAARRAVSRAPGVRALVLLYRRYRRRARIRRVLTSEPAVHRRYGVAPRAVVPGAALTDLGGARVLAQPIAVVGADWSLLWPYAPQLKRRPLTADQVWKEPPPAAPLPGRTLFAAVDGFSYYHWLLGTLPKILLARHEAGGLDRYDRVLVNPRHKGKVNFQTESLALLGLVEGRVRHLERGTHLVCEELTLPSEPCVDEQRRVMPWALALLRAWLLPLAESAADPGPRLLYVTRAKARRRRLVNEEAARAALEARGFVAVALEELPLLAQARWLATADVVVGLHGAGLANLAFSRPGTRVVEILPRAWENPCFRALATEASLEYAAVPADSVGPRVGFAADATVDLEALCAEVDRSLER